MTPIDPIAQNRATRRAAGRRARRVGAAATATAAATGTAAAVVGLLASPAGALATWTVTEGGDAGDGTCDATCTLRDAVDESRNDGDDSEIVFAASVTGTIVLTEGGLDVGENDFDITVTGPGAGTLTVQGDPDGNHIFYTDASMQTGTFSISGLTLTGGYSSFKGGAILMYGDDGNANLVINDMVITGNHAEYYGGGVAFYGDGNMTVTNSTISLNTTGYADGGGILFADSNQLSITNSTISGNTAGGEVSPSDGGGLKMYGESHPTQATIANSTIANNTATYNGGGIALYGNDLTLLQTTISGNTAVINLGDGLYLASSNSQSAARNAKPEHVRPEGKEPKPAKVAGSVSAQAVGTVTVTGTIISANDGPGNDIDTGAAGVAVNSTSSLIGTVGAGISLVDAGGTIISSTPGLGALANNGGFTQTMALLPGSAAIDTGPDPVPSFAGNDNDQRGAGFLRVVNGRVDIGAYEVQAIVVEPTFTG